MVRTRDLFLRSVEGGQAILECCLDDLRADSREGLTSCSAYWKDLPLSADVNVLVEMVCCDYSPLTTISLELSFWRSSFVEVSGEIF